MLCRFILHCEALGLATTQEECVQLLLRSLAALRASLLHLLVTESCNDNLTKMELRSGD